eukprot:COSAG02_NODE_47221_length_342_cov_3.522634_1_plen_62_part_10
MYSAQIEDSLLPAEQKDSMYSSPSLTDGARGSRGRASVAARARRQVVTQRHSRHGGVPRWIP